MNTLHRQQWSNYAGLAGFLFAAVVVTQGCGNDENPAPGTPTITGGTGGSGAKGGKSGKGGSTGGDTGRGLEKIATLEILHAPLLQLTTCE
jgi:hypothetical protein